MCDTGVLVRSGSLAIGSVEPWRNALSKTAVTRADLIEAMCLDVGLGRKACSSLLEELLELIADRLSADDTVKITNFGTFTVRRKSERMGRNPKSGEEVPIASRRVVSFRPARKLRHYANHPEDLPHRPRRQLELF